MPRRFFIVAREREGLYRSLRSALSNEPEAEVFFDRRKGGRSKAPADGERRERKEKEVEERLRTDGFAIVRVDPPAVTEGNIRWPA